MRVLFKGKYYIKEETENSVRLIPEAGGCVLTFTKSEEVHERTMKDLHDWRVSDTIRKHFNC